MGLPETSSWCGGGLYVAGERVGITEDFLDGEEDRIEGVQMRVDFSVDLSTLRKQSSDPGPVKGAQSSASDSEL